MNTPFHSQDFSGTFGVLLRYNEHKPRGALNCVCLFVVVNKLKAMPKVKRSRKPPPEGWELIEPTIDELDAKMREGIIV